MFRTRACFAVPVSARLSARLGAAGVAAVLVLGGCSGSGAEPDAEAAEQKVTSSASPSGSASPSEAATPTVTPTPTAAAYKPATAEGPAENVPLPVMPELAKEKSKEGLEAFAEYWYSLINYGYETGDPEPIREITGSDCSVCEIFYSSLESGFDDQDWIAGSAVDARDVHSDFILTPSGSYQVIIQITQEDLEFYGPGGIHYGSKDGIYSPAVQLIEASYGNGSWYAVLVENI